MWGVFDMVSCVSYLCISFAFYVYSALMCFLAFSIVYACVLYTVLLGVVLVMRVASYCKFAFWYVLCFGYACVCESNNEAYNRVLSKTNQPYRNHQVPKAYPHNRLLRSPNRNFSPQRKGTPQHDPYMVCVRNV